MIHLRVLTDAGIALEDEAVSVVAHGELGYVGILRNHAPLVTTLTPGWLTWRAPDGTTRARSIGVGLLEVAKNLVTIVTDRVSSSPQGESA